MNNIKILDCTLRDGGYINDWRFGERSIKKIIEKLAQSNIDIIECGFIRDDNYDEGRSVFNEIRKMNSFIYPKNKNILYVGMIDVPYIPIEKIEDCDGASIDGIRLTFHEKEIEEAMIYGKKLMDKGYKVFIQPVGTTSYTDEKLLDLIKRVNELRPYAFYLVDTLGIMYKNNLLRMYHLIDHNLHDSINIGFHSHNNLQLSFSNTQELLSLHTKRTIIIDSSVFGMGRGAGNLCTELITRYINDNLEEKYYVVPLLEIIDEHLSKFTTEAQWGYSVPYYIAATNNCHPNYASYLMNKQTISVKAINSILKQIPSLKKDVYDRRLIEDLYIHFQTQFVNDLKQLEEIKNYIGERNVLILAPGKSIDTEKSKIINFISKNRPFVIGVNFIPEDYSCDAIFISNSKRFNHISDSAAKEFHSILIKTSNITERIGHETYVVNYTDLLVDDPLISDNSGLMLINLLQRLSIENVYLAGFDGFSTDRKINYFSPEIINNSEVEELIKRNQAIRKQLAFVNKNINIKFVTSTIYDDLNALIKV